MNRLNEHLMDKAKQEFDWFKGMFTSMCSHLHRTFTITDEDADQITFDISGYPFTISRDLVNVPMPFGQDNIKVPVIEYQLSAWRTIDGGRNHPPEDVDDTLITTRSIADCIKKALIVVAQHEIDNMLEVREYNYQLEQERDLEAI